MCMLCESFPQKPMRPLYLPAVVSCRHGEPPTIIHFAPLLLSIPAASLRVRAVCPCLVRTTSHTSEWYIAGMPWLSVVHVSSLAEYPYSPPTRERRAGSFSAAMTRLGVMPRLARILRMIPPPSNMERRAVSCESAVFGLWVILWLLWSFVWRGLRRFGSG